MYVVSFTKQFYPEKQKVLLECNFFFARFQDLLLFITSRL